MLNNTYLKKGFAITIVILLYLMCCIPIIGKTINKRNNTSMNDNYIDSKDLLKMSSSRPPFKDPPNMVWNKTHGGIEGEGCRYIQQTCDDGYIIIGGTNSYGAGEGDIWLIKTDIDGNEEWNKTFGGAYGDLGYCVRETTDEGFIFTGVHHSGPSVDDPWYVWLIKTDKNGNMTWESKFSINDVHTYGKSVIELADGYLIMADFYIPGLKIITDIWLIRTDLEGNELWNNTIGHSDGDDHGKAVIQTSDGDFVIVGYDISSDNGVLLIKTDSNGNRLWRKELDGWEGEDIKECDDGGYIIAGEKHVCLIKTDKDGNMLWKKEYDWGGLDTALSVDHTYDGGYILTGNVVLYDKECEILLIKTDENGNREWEKTMGGKESDGAYCVIQSNDDTYVIAGSTCSFGTGPSDLWLIKVAPFENIRPSKPVIEGRVMGRPLIEYTYSTSSIDSDGEVLYYVWYWGDDSWSGLLGPYNSSQICIVSHFWLLKGSYTIRVKAIDIYSGDSDWATLIVTMPRYKALDSFFNFFNNLFSRFRIFMLVQ